MNVLLQVENQKGVEVCFEPSLEECFLAKASNLVSTPNLTPVTISSYSKDENVLNGSIAKTRIQISSVPKGFCQYLFDRKKAGVIKFRDSVLYVLPPKNRDDLTLPCISPSISTTAASHLEQVALTSVVEFPKSVSASYITTKISAPPTSSAPAAGGGKGGDAFFSSLLNKMQSTSKLRTIAVAAPTSVLARVEVVDRYDALANRIRSQLETFATDPSYMELRLEPMDKDGMYVVHDVVDDYPDLASFAVGDLEERHVVVYRRGFQPEGVDLHLQNVTVKNFARKKKDTLYGAAVSTNSLQAESISVAKVNPEGFIRDRRTIEEIQQEMKRRKLGLS